MDLHRSAMGSTHRPGRSGIESRMSTIRRLGELRRNIVHAVLLHRGARLFPTGPVQGGGYFCVLPLGARSPASELRVENVEAVEEGVVTEREPAVAAPRATLRSLRSFDSTPLSSVGTGSLRNPSGSSITSGATRPGASSGMLPSGVGNTRAGGSAGFMQAHAPFGASIQFDPSANP